MAAEATGRLLRRRDRQVFLLALRARVRGSLDLLELLAHLAHLTRDLGLTVGLVGAGQLEVQAAVFIGLQRGLEVGDGTAAASPESR